MFECESWTDELGQFRPGKLCARENEVEPENGANIRLIRVAPELLEALEECVTSYGATCFKNGAPSGDYAWRRIIAINEIATAAIRKAKGGA